MPMTRTEHEDLNIPVWESLCIALMPLPAGLLGAVLLSDGLYWLTGATVCALASEWLLGAGLATGMIAVASGLIRYVSVGRVRLSKRYWMHVIGSLLALLLAASDLIYRLNADSAGAVLPAGITLTAMVVCLLIAAGYLGHVLGPRALAEDSDDWELV